MKDHSDKSFWSSLFGLASPENKVPKMANPPAAPERTVDSAYGNTAIAGPWYPVTTKSFDGEKTIGELGPAVNYIPEHNGLRYRAYEAELKSDVVKIITGRFFKWVIGNGLKLQAEPDETVLRMEGVNEKLIDFRTNVEARFKIYSENTMSDFSNMTNLHKRAAEAFRTAFLSGDCLVVLRVENQTLTTQIIDGAEVSSPTFQSKFYDDAKAAGNRILHGIEINKKGEHIAFYVKSDTSLGFAEYERVAARGEESGLLLAWMVYGDKHRINHLRGIPKIAAILEKVEKLDRYTEASVGGAEERAKIVFAIEHDRNSTGENPMVEQMRRNLNPDVIGDDSFEKAEAVSKNISRTTSKQTFNMPIGAKMKTLASQQEDQYEPFFNAVFVQLCAAVDIPPEVALQKYSSNYSASRAAINGWGYIVDFYRKDFAFDFYKKIYRAWLEVEVLKGKINSPGFLKAIMKNDEFTKEAFCNSKFTGINMPHIDPLKEVKAVREMLGSPAEGILPLISYDRASEQLNQGEWTENYTKYKEETKDIVIPNKDESGNSKGETVESKN